MRKLGWDGTAKARYIKEGKEYDKYFEPYKNTYFIVKKHGASVHNSIDLMKKVIKDCYTQCAKIAQVLKGKDVKSTCRNIWNFVYEHIQYAPDAVGDEIREPIATWANRRTGLDCDCYSVFISCILQNLGIRHKLRMTEYKKSEGWQHVYPVALDEQGNEIVIDCVAHSFNYEVPYLTKQDFTMQLSRLGNLPQQAQGERAVYITKQEFLDIFKNNISNVANQVNRMRVTPYAIAGYQAVLSTAMKLGASKQEFDEAIIIGSAKKSLAGLGIALDAVGAIVGGVSNLTTSIFGSKALNQQMDIQRLQNEGTEIKAQTEQLAIQAQLDAKKQETELQKQQLEASKQNTKLYAIVAGVGIVVIGTVIAIASSNKTKVESTKSLKGTPNKAFKGKKPITIKF
jgi:hypothetical protein